MDIELNGALTAEAQNIHLSGRFMPPEGSRPGALEQMTLSMERVLLERLLPPPAPGAPTMRGRLTLSLHGRAPTLDPALLTHSVSAEGNVKVDEPVIANLNILREVFNKFAMIPGLVERLQERLPPDYQAKLTAPDTVLNPIDLSVKLEAGEMRFDDLRIGTDVFALAGSGTVGLDGAVNLQGTLRLEPAFTAALVRSVEELQYLANAQGELEIPLTGTGRMPQVAVLPDLDYVASKLLVTKVQEKVQDLLGSFLEKAIKSEQPSDQVSPTPQTQPASP
jgi:hypothetical protein